MRVVALLSDPPLKDLFIQTHEYLEIKRKKNAFQSLAILRQ